MGMRALGCVVMKQSLARQSSDSEEEQNSDDDGGSKMNDGGEPDENISETSDVDGPEEECRAIKLSWNN